MSIEEIAQTIAIMRMREESTYRCRQYFPSQKTFTEAVDEECRVKMTQWCFQVVEFCNFNREIVGIGMSYLDRFLCTPYGEFALKDRKIYQLASMCSLYMATKLFETREMDLRLLSQLSRGVYTESEIAAMEASILSALNWFVHPPTSVSFINECMRAIPSIQKDRQTFMTLIDIARSHTELAVADYSFVTMNQSSIALASIANAFDIMSRTIPDSLRLNVLEQIALLANVDMNSTEVLQARKMLSVNWEKSQKPTTFQVVQTNERSSAYASGGPENVSMSPVSIINRTQ